MCDMMIFPDTVEEFMEEYKMIDRDQVYSNGIEYVPIFRMEQWFRHKKGEWINDGIYAEGHSERAYRCSVCDEQFIGKIGEYNFCPRCGADMKRTD